jgi:hypothetical protein
MAHVFISYSQRDTAFVRQVADALRDQGKDICLAVEASRMPGGSEA